MPKPKLGASPIHSAAARLSNAIQNHGEESAEAQAARLTLRMLTAEAAIRRLVAEAPPLPEAARQRLASILLHPAGAR